MSGAMPSPPKTRRPASVSRGSLPSTSHPLRSLGAW